MERSFLYKASCAMLFSIWISRPDLSHDLGSNMLKIYYRKDANYGRCQEKNWTTISLEMV